MLHLRNPAALRPEPAIAEKTTCSICCGPSVFPATSAFFGVFVQKLAASERPRASIGAELVALPDVIQGVAGGAKRKRAPLSRRRKSHERKLDQVRAGYRQDRITCPRRRHRLRPISQSLADLGLRARITQLCLSKPTLSPRRGTNGAPRSCSYGFRTIWLTTRRFMRAPTKGFVLNHCSKSLNRRLLRNVLISTALAAVLASGASIRPTSAHPHHGQTRIDGKQTSHSVRLSDVEARGHTRRGVRDKLLAPPHVSRKDVDHSVEIGRSLENSGIASVYSDQHTASGEKMNSDEMTAAHRTLPFGTKVTVLNRVNGRSAVVRINDRGPFIRGRVIDLSPAAGRVLGIDGLALVSLSQ